ncbi:NADH-quinone oxidoreductase subunit NuoK [Fulvivirgaceae bacterium LMO-SS25]
MIGLDHFLILGAALFSLGLAIVISRRNAVMVLMGIELMLNASNINLVAFGYHDPNLMQGQLFALFVIVIAAAEAAIGLAIVMKVYRYYYSADLQELSKEQKIV